MAHFYLNGKLLDENHPRWMDEAIWPRNKSGSLKKRPGPLDKIAMGAVPSVTTIANEIGDSGWMVGWGGSLGILAGLMAKDKDEANAQFRLLREQAADRGTAFHSAIQNFFESGEEPEDPAMLRACRDLKEWNEDLAVAKKEWVAEGMSEDVGIKGMTTALPYAGTIDAILDKGDEVFIFDWKTTIGKRPPKPSELAQIAAYAKTVKSKPVHCYNVYINQDTGEIYKRVAWNSTQLNWGWTYFNLACKAFVMSLNKPEGVS